MVLSPYTGHEPTFWKYITNTLFRVIGVCESVLIHKLSSFEETTHTHTRHNQFSMCKQCNSAVKGTSAATVWCSPFCVKSFLSIERPWWTNTARTVRRKREAFCSVELWPSPPRASYRADRLDHRRDDIIRSYHRRRWHKEERLMLGYPCSGNKHQGMSLT